MSRRRRFESWRFLETSTMAFPHDPGYVGRDYGPEDFEDGFDDETYTCPYCGTTQWLDVAMDRKHERVRPGCVACGGPVILRDDGS